jgi:hypothetical protein
MPDHPEFWRICWPDGERSELANLAQSAAPTRFFEIFIDDPKHIPDAMDAVGMFERAGVTAAKIVRNQAPSGPEPKPLADRKKGNHNG